jgi:hypothetical protein
MSFETHAQAPDTSTTLGVEASARFVGAGQEEQRNLGDTATPSGVADVLHCAAECQTQHYMPHMQEGSLPPAGPPQHAAGLVAASVALPKRTNPAQVLAIGDSVMLGASQALRQAVTDVQVDAQVGRQVSTALQMLRERKDARLLAPTVIIHLGNNGRFSRKQFDEMMQLLQEVPRVVFLTTKVPRTWQEPNNHALADGVRRYPNTRLVDWHTQGTAHPEWFWQDGIHLRPEGAKMYANLIAAMMR